MFLADFASASSNSQQLRRLDEYNFEKSLVKIPRKDKCERDCEQQVIDWSDANCLRGVYVVDLSRLYNLIDRRKMSKNLMSKLKISTDVHVSSTWSPDEEAI